MTNQDTEAQKLMDQMAEAFATATDPKRWTGRLDEEGMERVFVLSGVHAILGIENQAGLVAFQTAFVQGASREQRLAALQQLLEIGENMPDVPVGVAISPLLYRDDDPQILSSGALYFCGLALPGPDGDVTRGAEMLLDVIKTRTERGESTEAGILAAGLLLMGDERFRGRMDQAWELMDYEGRRCMGKAESGFATEAHVSFLLDRLEETDDPGLYGTLAASLARFADNAAERGIHSVQRSVPVSVSPEEPVKLLESWTLADYAPRIMPRLQVLAEEEDDNGDAVMHIVVERWQQGGSPGGGAGCLKSILLMFSIPLSGIVLTDLLG
jgi:hypothetical protein